MNTEMMAMMNTTVSMTRRVRRFENGSNPFIVSDNSALAEVIVYPSQISFFSVTCKKENNNLENNYLWDSMHSVVLSVQ